jgi:hypothetical protein
LLVTRWCLWDPTKEKVLEFKWLGSKNGCFEAIEGAVPGRGKTSERIPSYGAMSDVPHEGSPDCMGYSLWPPFDSSLEGLFYP